MSRDNIGIVLRATEAVYRQPRPDYDTINELFAPDHVMLSAWSTAFGEPEVTGAAGFKRWMEETQSSMPWVGRIDGAVDVGSDTVLLSATLDGQGATSGIEGELRIWCLYFLRTGRIFRTETYTNPEDALRAATAAGA